MRSLMSKVTDADITFLQQLPSYIRYSCDACQEDTVLVHAGLEPFKSIEQQAVKVMATIRNVLPNGLVHCN